MVYSSKYYDPVKAHEYYMKHRVLKGKKASTATLNETGRKAADYVKNQISEEQKKSVEAENKSYSDKIFSQTQTAKVKISALQKKYSRLSSAQKKILGPKLKKELEKMKQENEAKRQKIMDQHSKNIKNLDDKYTKTYEKELEKMNADSSMVNKKKNK